MFKVGDKVVLTEEAKQKFKTAIWNDPCSGWNKSFEQMVYDDSVGVVIEVIGTQAWLCDGKFYVDCGDIILESTPLAESYNPSEAKPPEVVALGKELKSTDWTDKHYDAFYHLTPKDIERGWIKIDPYRVSKQWRLGAKDESGALFHVLKTLARIGEKNSVEREVKALIAQIKCFAEIENIEVE